LTLKQGRENNENMEITLVSRIDESFDVMKLFLEENDITWKYIKQSGKERMIAVNSEVIKNLDLTQPLEIKADFPTSKTSCLLPVRVIP
jgi:hypothetical protein